MQYSTNLLLEKPEWTDNTNILTDLNYNWDILDAIIHLLDIEAIWKEVFTDVAAANPSAIHAAIAGTGIIQNVTSGITNPAEGRNATVSATNNATPSGNVVLSGLVRGVLDSETFAISPGSITYGNKPFDTITNIQLPAGLTAADTVSIGVGDKFGLLHEITVAGQVYKITVNAVEVTSAYAALVNVTYGTIDFSTVGTYQDMVVWYYV